MQSPIPPARGLCAVIGSQAPAAFQGSGRHPCTQLLPSTHPLSTHLNNPPAPLLPANISITVPHSHIAFHRLSAGQTNATVDAKLSVPKLRVFERVCGRTRRCEGAERPPGRTPSALASHRRICLTTDHVPQQQRLRFVSALHHNSHGATSYGTALSPAQTIYKAKPSCGSGRRC